MHTSPKRCGVQYRSAIPSFPAAQSAQYNTITIADTSITKAEQEAHNLKIGDIVKMYFAPEKTIGRVKIIFD